MTARLLTGDCRDVLKTLDACSVDAVVCDPPYELGFMGKRWDNSGIAYDVGMWSEVWRVAKPGAHLVTFGGTRTHHRLMVALEDAGWEIRDCLMWLFGSGFPKSLDVSKAIDKAAGAEREITATREKRGAFGGVAYAQDAWTLGQSNQPLNLPVTSPATLEAAQWDGWGTALKPAYEPIILARKPLSEGTVAANVLRWGTGAINVDACRIGTTKDIPSSSSDRMGANGIYGGGMKALDARSGMNPNQGRWPANVILSHSLFCVPVGTRRVKGSNGKADYTPTGVQGPTSFIRNVKSGAHHADADGYETVEAWECVEDCPVAMLDAQSGQRTSGSGAIRSRATTTTPAMNGGLGVLSRVEPSYLDSGGASRFFYVAKASRAERERGLAPLPLFGENGIDARRGAGSLNIRSDEHSIRNGMDTSARNHHPTVKPLALMRYLVRLVTPPGGVVLDPFCGSGTTPCACKAEGFGYIAIDREADYIDIATRRIAAV